MDSTEDVSARILLRHILQTEPPRTPVTRSASVKQESPRRSSRLGGKDAAAQSPQNVLRRSMKNKLRESITRKSLPFVRRTASLASRKSTPAPASLLLDDGETPRHILRKILQTEPVRSPVFHKKVLAEEPQPPSADSSISSKRPSVELTTFDLPDLTIGVATSPVKGLSRKRPHRTLDVTAFEKRCQAGDDVNTETDNSVQENSSLSISSTSLSLKTPFVEAQTVRRGLQRRAVSKRRKLTEEQFGDAVKERQSKSEGSAVAGGNDTAFPEDFTLGLSKFVEPDISIDVVNCNTALFAQHEPSLLMAPTQEKATVMASQLQRQIAEAEHEEEGRVPHLLPPEETEVMSRNDLDGLEAEAAEGLEGTFDMPTTVRDDEAQTDEVETQEGAEMEEPVVGSQTDEDEDELQPEEEAEATSLSEEEAATGSQSEGAGSQNEENEGESEGEQESPEDPSPDPQAEDEHDDTPGEEDEEQTSQCVVEHISRQARRSEGGVVPVREAGGDDSERAEWSDGKHNTSDAPSSRNIDSGRLSSGAPGEEDEEDEEEESSVGEQLHLSPAEANDNSSHPLYDDTGLLSNDPAEEDAAAEEASDAEEDAAAEEASDAGEDAAAEEASEAGEDAAAEEASDAGEDAAAEEASDAGEDAAAEEASEAGEDAAAEEASDAGEDAAAEEASDAGEDAAAEEGAATEEASAAGEAAAEESDEEIVEDDDSEGDEEVPAFVREKINFAHPFELAPPSVPETVQPSASNERDPAAKPKQARKRTGKRQDGLPKSYLMNVFKHFAKTKVSTDVYPVLREIMDKYFQRLAEDLETYAAHAKRKTIEYEDCLLLLKRQGYVNDKVPVEVLIEKYLRMDQRRLLIPCANSGNLVMPKKR